MLKVFKKTLAIYSVLFSPQRQNSVIKKKIKVEPGVVAQTCNPRILGGPGRRIVLSPGV